MNYKSILILAIGTSAFAPIARGDAYSGIILYPLAVPDGAISITVNDSLAGQTGGFDSDNSTESATNAIVWTAAGATNLNPTNLNGISVSAIVGANDTRQVGYGEGSGTGDTDHALIWSGSAARVLDINPTDLPGISGSIATAASATQQVGLGFGSATGEGEHAILWTGSAASAVDLNPLTGFQDSVANGVGGTQQIGSGSGAITGDDDHALLWTGTAASAIDLHPSDLTGFLFSEGIATNGAQQVGFGGDSANVHALLWNGTPASAVDLNPTTIPGITDSEANDTNGVFQVGYGYNGGDHVDTRALLWNGTALSAFDLQTLLPSTGTWISSNAISIDSSGNIFGIANGTFNGTTGEFAVEWSTLSVSVPEPSMGSILLLAGVGILVRRRRQQMTESKRS